MTFSKHLAALAVTGLLTTTALPALAQDGWIVKDSGASVDATADKLVSAVENAGAKVFARVDHAAGAESIGEDLPDMTMVMFGNPKIGTSIMKAAPQAGIDLPLRVLIWDEDGQTRIGYLDPAEFAARYQVEGADAALTAMTKALGKLTDAAAQ